MIQYLDLNFSSKSNLKQWNSIIKSREKLFYWNKQHLHLDWTTFIRLCTSKFRYFERKQFFVRLGKSSLNSTRVNLFKNLAKPSKLNVKKIQIWKYRTKTSTRIKRIPILTIPTLYDMYIDDELKKSFGFRSSVQ